MERKIRNGRAGAGAGTDELLDTFLSHGAISRAQYDKSLGDLTVKMGFGPETPGP